MNRHLAWLVMTIFLPSCMVGPKYQVPSVKVPHQFNHQLNQCNAKELVQWWHCFDDDCLNNLITQAVNNNYPLRIAVEKIEETRAIYQIQQARLLPNIAAVSTFQGQKISSNLGLNVGLLNPGGGGVNINPQALLIGDQTGEFVQVGFDAVWEMDFWGKLRHARQAAYAQYEAQIESMRDVYIMLLADVAKAYIDTCAIQQKIMIFTDLLNVNQELLNLTNDRFCAGLNSETPSLRQLVLVNEIKNQIVQQQEQLQQTVNRLAILLGQNPEGFTLHTQKTIPMSQLSPALGLPSELLRRRPDIRNAERSIAVATERLGESIAAWFPSFSLLGTIGFGADQGSTIFNSNSFTWSVGPAMNWPILNFGRIKFDIKVKESVERQAILNYGNTVINAFADVENALVSYCANNDQLRIVTEQLLAATKGRDLVASLFASGLTDKLELLVVERIRLLIALQLANIQQTLSSSLIFVYKALGGGWEHV